ncbi:MAG: RNA polymerase sigma factor [Gammaproteobacteria bacterium]|nr:RNA polymerase sigma factor [Gammaproteobacteria bacterium]MBQ0838852.1 RNA polymerase sigma factor [Gammaproteobacteria bacterium]
MGISTLKRDLRSETKASRAALDGFLASVQRRAFAMARAASGNADDAMDVVQDSMLQLVKSYGDRDADEWRKLFYRILNNKINDLFRRRKLQRRFGALLPRLAGHNSEEQDLLADPFDKIAAADGDPAVHLQRERTIASLHGQISQLPRRQREAFMLRCWEGFSTRETAQTMGCSEGSVKTHYSRALSALRVKLGEALEENPYEN